MATSSSVLRRVLRVPYNRFVRPYLPKKIAVYNGVAVKESPLLDQKVAFHDYEEKLIEGIRKEAKKDESVVQIGGGNGPSAVAAARAVGPNGRVTVYEGGIDYAEKIRQTLELNNVTQRVDVRTNIVAEDRDVWGDTSNVETLPPEEIPECDVLVLDCEGAEQTILPRFTCTPEVLIVESHGELGSPTEDVKRKVEERGYEIKEVAPEVEEDDIYVIIAEKSE